MSKQIVNQAYHQFGEEAEFDHAVSEQTTDLEPGYEESKLILAYQLMYCEICETRDYVLATGDSSGKPSC